MFLVVRFFGPISLNGLFLLNYYAHLYIFLIVLPISEFQNLT
jgi:hypothetical protein